MTHLLTPTRGLLFVLALALALAMAGLAGAARADGTHFFGVWDVNTRLTAASAAVNPGYEAGDLRVDVWHITGTPAAPVLTTQHGSIAGQISGDQAIFAADIPLDQIVLMRLYFSVWLTSSRSMTGTITAEYWDTRFRYKVGLDAWSFEGVRR